MGAMGKKTKKSEPATEAPGNGPFHSAFSGLASLRDALPSSDLPDPELNSGPDAKSTSDKPTGSLKLVLRREKKGRAGKTVTRLLGLPSPEDRTTWAKRLKKELGCGATIEGDDVILLGDVGERAKTRLEAGGLRRVVLGN